MTYDMLDGSSFNLHVIPRLIGSPPLPECVLTVARAPSSFWLQWSVGVRVGGSVSPAVSPVPAFAFSEAV